MKGIVYICNFANQKHDTLSPPMLPSWSTRIEDAGIAIRHSRGYIISILQGPEMGLRGWTWCVHGHKNKLTLSKTYFFVIEKYVEDVKQDEKHVPDLLESIMRPTCLVKEELRTNSCKSNGLQTRLKKNTKKHKRTHVFHPSSQAPALA